MSFCLKSAEIYEYKKMTWIILAVKYSSFNSVSHWWNVKVLDIICSLDRSWEVLPTNGQLYFHIIMQANYSGLDETKVQTQNILCFKTQGHNFLWIFSICSNGQLGPRHNHDKICISLACAVISCKIIPLKYST